MSEADLSEHCCPSCGAALRQSARFCPRCGLPLTVLTALQSKKLDDPVPLPQQKEEREGGDKMAASSWRVFISSTRHDLEDYRDAVITQLKRMQIPDLEMDYFGTSGEDSTEASLSNLEMCNIYIGLIGHRYGSLSPDKERSITRREYERAYELFRERRMHLLLYLAHDGILLPAHLHEPDGKRVKQQEFRKLLLNRHTPSFFRTRDELVQMLSADFFRLVDPVPMGKEKERFTIFGHDEVLFREKLDTSAQERMQKVQGFLHFLADNFASLFQFDEHGTLEVPPLLSEARKWLGTIIPAIELNNETGILERTGVRHVIIRKDTLLSFLKAVPPKELTNVGKSVGRGAAADLLKHTIEGKKLIPASAEALITLWDYWDSTGGWGKLQLLKTRGKSLEDTGDGKAEPSDPGEWDIQINNNILSTDVLQETHDLCNFWCGYIHGFLDTALSGISKVMNTLAEDQRSEVTLPAYHRVLGVQHLPDNDLDRDVFRVRFAVERYSKAREYLSEAQQVLREAHYLASMPLCHEALLETVKVNGGDFEKLLQGVQLSDQVKDVLRAVKAGELSSPTREKAGHWFDATNRFIQQLS